MPDVPALTDLCTQLGYPAIEMELILRLKDILADSAQILLAVETDTDEVIGWIQGFIRKLVVIDAHIELAGLVIVDGFDAKKWAKS